MMMFLVLPSLNDAIAALVLMLDVATIPSVLKIIIRQELEDHRPMKVTIDSVAIAVQLSALIVWPLAVWLSDKQTETHLMWSVPVSLVLVEVVGELRRQ